MKIKEQSSKIIDIVSNALKVGVTCVFVVYFRSQNTYQLACMYELTCVHLNILTGKRLSCIKPRGEDYKSQNG